MYLRTSFFVVLFLISFRWTYTELLVTSTEKYKDDLIYKKYIDMDTKLKETMNYGMKKMLPYVLEANEYLNTSLSCRRDMLILFNEVRRLKLSAITFLDAIGKMPAGFFVGNMNPVGDYDECLNSSVALRNGSVAFQGKYCLVKLQPILPKRNQHEDYESALEKLIEKTSNTSETTHFFLSLATKFYDAYLRFGICVPSGCSNSDISESVKYIADKAYMNADILYCEVDEGTPFPVGKIIAIVVFSSFGLLAISGTTIDYFNKKNNTKNEAFGIKFLLCFSILRNFPKVISTKSTGDSIMCLNGIRVLSQFYIILLHRYALGIFTGFEGHIFHTMKTFPTFFFQIVSNSVLTVDLFFLLGGLTNVYTKLKIKKGKINYFRTVIHRLWRIYPTLLCSILVVFLFYDFRGPIKNYLHEIYSDKCSTYWWRTALFINNFFDSADTCVPQSWYISADMHMFLLSLFVTSVFLRYGTKGVLLCMILIISGLSSTIAVAWHKNLLPNFFPRIIDPERIREYLNVHMYTFPHIAPYFIGVIVGYILQVKKELKLSKMAQFIGWTAAILAFTTMLFMTKRWNAGVLYTAAESSMYYAFAKILYPVAVGWMIVCCARGYGGIINYILSLKIWIPLARISYMLFLIAPTLQMFTIGNLRMPLDGHLMIRIWIYMAETTIACFLSLALVVTVESPIEEVEKLLFYRKPVENLKNAEISNEDWNSFKSDGLVVKSKALVVNMKAAVATIQLNDGLQQ